MGFFNDISDAFNTVADAVQSGASTTTAPTPTLVTDGQVITIADTTGRLLTCGLGGVAVCIADPQLVQVEASKTQWRIQLLKNGFFKLQSLHNGSLLMAERCYKDPHVVAPTLDAGVIGWAYASYTAFANTSALTTTLSFATEPEAWLPRSSGSPINGVHDLAGFEQAMEAAQTMWAYTSKQQLVCAYDLVWQSFYNANGISEEAMRVRGMVSADDLQKCVDLFEGRMHGSSGMWVPNPMKMRVLTSMVWDGPARNPKVPDSFASPNGLATAAWYGSMPPRWVEDVFHDAGGQRNFLPPGHGGQGPSEDDIQTITALDKRLCTTWRLDDVPSEQVFVGGVFRPLISSSFAPELIPGEDNAPMQVPAYMIKVQTTLKPGEADRIGKSVTYINYGVRVADVMEKTPVKLVCNGIVRIVQPGITMKVESEFSTLELNISYVANGLAACPLAISYLAIEGVPVEKRGDLAYTFVVDPSDAHSPKLSKLSADDLQSLNPAAKPDECDKAASAIRALHVAVASPVVGRPLISVPALPGMRRWGPWDKIKDTATDIGNKTKDAGTDIGNKTKDAGTDIGNKTKDAGTDIGNKIKDAGTDAGDKIKDAGTDAGKALKDNVIDPAISGVTAAADAVASTATSEAWSVIHLAESGKNVVVDTAQAFTNDVMNGVKVLVTIEGKLAHYVAQGVRDVVGFARLCLQQLEIALEKIEEFLKLWLDFGDFQVTRDCLGNFYTDIRDKVFLNRAFFIDPARDYLVGQVHGLEDKMDAAFASIEKYLGVKSDDNTTPDVNSLTMKAFNVAYSGLTWLLDKIARLLPSGAFQVDADAIDKIIEDTCGVMLDKYKDAPNTSSAFADVMDDMKSGITKLATGTSNAIFGLLLKSLHTVAKAALSTIAWGIEIMADLIYYGFQAFFKIMDLAGGDVGDLLPGGFGWMSSGLRLFGVHLPTFTMMDMALWPQAVIVTLVLKSYGADAWNSFKDSKGHLLGGLPATMAPSGAQNADASAVNKQAAPSVRLDASNSLPTAHAPPISVPAPHGRTLAATASDAESSDAHRGVVAMRALVLAADIVYGIYYVIDTKALAFNEWTEGPPMLLGSFLKGVISVSIMTEQCIKFGKQAFPTIVYNAIVLVGVCLKVDIRRGAPAEGKKEARQKALIASSILNAVAISFYAGLSAGQSNNFDGEVLGTQLVSLSYTMLQAYVALRVRPGAGGMLSLQESFIITAGAVGITGTNIGLAIARIKEA